MIKLWSSVPRAHMWLEEHEQLLSPEHSHRWRKVCREATAVPFNLEIFWENIRLESWESVAIAMRQMNRFYRHTHTCSVQICKQLQPPDCHYHRSVADSPRPPAERALNCTGRGTLAGLESAGARTQPSNLFVPVEWAQALMNWHRCVPLPHSHDCHYTRSDHFTPPPRLFILQQSWSEEPLKPQLPHLQHAQTS